MIKPLRDIGKYGGTWRRGFTGPFDTSNGHRAAQNDKLLYFDYTGTKIVPNIARAWEVSPDGRVTTILLRRGMRWSDGQPFTADDFVFWFEEVYQNKELVPTPLPVMTINGKPIAVRKVDAATVQFVAPDPYFALPTVLASVWGIGHHARYGRDALGGFAPAHYLKQFHPKWSSKDEVTKKAAEMKFDSWVALFKNRNDACRNPDLPGGDALEDGLADQHADLGPRAQSLQRLGGQRRPPAPLHRPDPDDAGGEPRADQSAGDRRRVRLAGAAHRHQQAAGAPREPEEGRLPRLPRPVHPGGRRGALLQPELRPGSGDREVARHPRVPDRALARHRPPAGQRDLRAGARADRLGGAGRAHASTSRDRSTRPCTAPTTSRRPTRCSTSSG